MDAWFLEQLPQAGSPLLLVGDAKDFQKATIRLYHDAGHASAVRVQVVTP